jgi:uncharacterized phage protein (TIGR01671 family)
MERINRCRGKAIQDYPYVLKGTMVDGQVVYGWDNKIFIVGQARDKDDQSLVFSALTNLYEIDPKTLGRYIGILDKDNVEICEGDILQWLYDGRYHSGAVIWDKYRFIVDGFFVATQDNPRDAFCGDVDLKIIGNIHNQVMKYVFIIEVNGVEDVLITDIKHVTFNTEDSFILHGMKGTRIDGVTSVRYVKQVLL